MEVVNTVEHEDGSATLTFDLTPEEAKLLINDSLLRAIKNSIVDANKQSMKKYASNFFGTRKDIDECMTFFGEVIEALPKKNKPMVYVALFTLINTLAELE
jgi:hypothetical protein